MASCLAESMASGGSPSSSNMEIKREQDPSDLEESTENRASSINKDGNSSPPLSIGRDNLNQRAAADAFKTETRIEDSHETTPPESTDLEKLAPPSLKTSLNASQKGDIKQEMVTSEYSVEWWYDMGPTSPKSGGDESWVNKAATGKAPETLKTIEQKLDTGTSDNSLRQIANVTDEIKCGGKDPAIENDSDGENTVPNLDTKASKLSFPGADNSMTVSGSSYKWCKDTANSFQEDCVLNLSIPKSKRTRPTADEKNIAASSKHNPLSTMLPFRHSIVNNYENTVSLGVDAPLGILSSRSEITNSASTLSFSRTKNSNYHKLLSDSNVPQILGLCRMPLHPRSTIMDLHPFQTQATTSCTTSFPFPLFPPLPPQSCELAGPLMPPPLAANAALDMTLTTPSKRLEIRPTCSATSYYSLNDVGLIGCMSSGTAVQNQSRSPFSRQDGSERFEHPYEVSSRPGVMLLASQTMCVQRFPCMAVLSTAPEKSPDHKDAAFHEALDREKPQGDQVPISVSTNSNGSKSVSDLDCSIVSNHEEHTDEHGCASDTLGAKNETEAKQCQMEPHSTGRDNRSKTNKMSRKAKFMEALGFVDPTHIKLSQDDELLEDSELMMEYANGDNNSSDEDWVPEVNEGKTEEDFLQGHVDSSEDETHSLRRRKPRQESKRNRPNACRRGRPTAQAIACPTCGKVFHGKYHLKRHEMSHTETRPFECSTCGKRFKQKAHLQGHESIHLRQKRYSRQKIERPMPRNQPEITVNDIKCSGRPKKNYSEKELSCATCHKSFKTLYRLKRHVQSHTDERPYLCRVCGKGFKQTGHRNEHEANHEKNRRKFLCNMCGVIFRCRSSFNNHLKTHRGEKQRETSTPISVDETGDQDAENYGAEMLTRTGYDCPYCSDRFSTAQGLNRHLDSHIEIHQRLHVQPYTCKHCNRSFTYKHNLHKHTLAHFAPEKYALYHKAKLEQHVASGKPCYKCHTCSKMFIRKETLVKHSKIHTGCKPFKCIICAKEFSQNVHLKVHMRKHTGSRPFQCKRCNRGFIDSTALAKHIEYEACVAENVFYVCKLCDKRFYHLGSIKQHIQRHHKEMDAEQFIHRIQRQAPKIRNMRNERSQHTCQVCSSNFTEKGNLVRHVKRKHKDLLKVLRDDRTFQEKTSCHSLFDESCSSDSSFVTPGEKSEDGEKSPGKNSIRDKISMTESNKHQTATNISHFDEFPKYGFQGNHAEEPNCTLNYLSHKSVIMDSRESNPSHFSRPATKDSEPFGQNRANSKITVLAETKLPPDSIDHQYKMIQRDGQMPYSEDSHVSGAANFLYQFGLMVSDKAKRGAHANEGKSRDTWQRSPGSNAACSLSLGVASGNTGETETALDLVVSLKKDRVSEIQDDGSFAIDLSCRSKLYRSEVDVHRNAAFTSNKSKSPSEDEASYNSQSFHSVSTYSSSKKNSDGNKSCNDTTLVRKGATQSKTEMNPHSKSSLTADLSHYETIFKEADEETLTLSVHERYSLVQPWLKQLFGRRSRGLRRSRRQARAKLVSKEADGIQGTHNTSKEEVSVRVANYEDQSLTLYLPGEDSHPADGCCDVPIAARTELMLLNNKNAENDCSVSASGQPNESERESLSKCADSKKYEMSYELKHVASEEIGAANKSGGNKTYGEISNKSYTESNIDLTPTLTPSSNSGVPVLPSIQTPQSMTICNPIPVQLFDPPSQRLNFGLLSMSSHPFVASGDMTFSSTTPGGSSREVMTQTPSPSGGISAPQSLTSSPLTTTLLLRTPDVLPQQPLDRVPRLGSSARGPKPSSKPKEPFPCQTCGKCFNARHQLKRHEMTHTEIRPYGCPECGRAFRQKVHLSDHLKRHGGQRPFACPACGKRFVLKNELKQHAKNYCRKGQGHGSREAGDHLGWQPHQHHRQLRSAVSLDGFTDLGSDGGRPS